jgi:hypothetical protein
MAFLASLSILQRRLYYQLPNADSEVLTERRGQRIERATTWTVLPRYHHPQEGKGRGRETKEEEVEGVRSFQPDRGFAPAQPAASEQTGGSANQEATEYEGQGVRGHRRVPVDERGRELLFKKRGDDPFIAPLTLLQQGTGRGFI